MATLNDASAVQAALIRETTLRAMQHAKGCRLLKESKVASRNLIEECCSLTLKPPRGFGSSRAAYDLIRNGPKSLLLVADSQQYVMVPQDCRRFTIDIRHFKNTSLGFDRRYELVIMDPYSRMSEEDLVEVYRFFEVGTFFLRLG